MFIRAYLHFTAFPYIAYEPNLLSTSYCISINQLYKAKFLYPDNPFNYFEIVAKVQNQGFCNI